MMNQTHPNPSQEAGYNDFWRSEDGRYLLIESEAIAEGLDWGQYREGVGRARIEHMDATAKALRYSLPEDQWISEEELRNEWPGDDDELTGYDEF